MLARQYPKARGSVLTTEQVCPPDRTVLQMSDDGKPQKSMIFGPGMF